MNTVLQPELLNMQNQEEFLAAGLRGLAKELRQYTPPGYPLREQRFISVEPVPDIPEGPWDTSPLFPNIADHIDIRARGLSTDRWGRPIHPWLGQLTADASVGVVTGKADYYYWGPNHTADPIIIVNDCVLLVQREDTGAWAFPGGYVDPGETAVEAGVREAKEEATILLPEDFEPILVYQGPVMDVRMTAHAWPETTSLLFDLGTMDSLPDIRANDGVIDQRWQLLADARTMALYGSHNQLLELAVARRDVLLRE